MNPPQRDQDDRQLSEGPSGDTTGETAGGGADAVPDTPDALPRAENEPTRQAQPDYPDPADDQQNDDSDR